MPSSIISRAVIDTNVIVSAILWGGRPQKVVNVWLQGGLEVLLSPFLAAEVATLLERFALPQADQKRILEILQTHTAMLVPPKLIRACRDPKDNQILDLCVAGRANYLITGDKDLLTIRKIEETKIMTPSQFLKLIAKI